MSTRLSAGHKRDKNIKIINPLNISYIQKRSNRGRDPLLQIASCATRRSIRYLTMYNKSKPQSMLMKPVIRKVRSSSCETVSSKRRSDCGFKNGTIPSITSKSASAASRSCQSTPISSKKPRTHFRGLSRQASSLMNASIRWCYCQNT